MRGPKLIGVIGDMVGEEIRPRKQLVARLDAEMKARLQAERATQAAAAKKRARAVAELNLPDVSLDQFEDWREGKAQLEKLMADLAIAEAEKEKVLAAQRRRVDSGANGEQHRRALARADGLLPDAVPPIATEYASSYRRLTKDIAEIREAIAIQRERVSAIQSARSAELCGELLPPYAVIVGNLARCMAQLSVFHDQQAIYRAHFHELGIGVNSFLRPMPVNAVGSIADRQSGVSRTLKEAVDFGFMSADEFKKLTGRDVNE